jgi:hypothetical protein
MMIPSVTWDRRLVLVENGLCCEMPCASARLAPAATTIPSRDGNEGEPASLWRTSIAFILKYNYD